MAEILYYSTNTSLAYLINEYYYQGLHFVYCAPYFDRNPDPLYPVPASSNPKILYERFREESKTSDQNAHTIQANRLGLLRGVEARLTAGIITPEARLELIKIIEGADNAEFRPVLYVIPSAGVHGLLNKVPYPGRASAFFDEYSGDVTKDKFHHIEY